MAETKTLEREYIIPLRRAWLNVPEYKRARQAVKAIKIFIAKHMKVPDRDVDKVKVDVYLNNEIWFRGRTKPPTRIRVKAKKVGDIVTVDFVETPQFVKFLKAKHQKMHKKSTKKPEVKEKHEHPEEKTEEQKHDEKEKEKAVEQQNIKQAEQAVKEHKHLTPIKEPKINRMALKK